MRVPFGQFSGKTVSYLTDKHEKFNLNVKFYFEYI
jgi:hypothetical protein